MPTSPDEAADPEEPAAGAPPPGPPREVLREFLRGLLEHKGDRAAFADDEALIGNGRLDSVDVLEIVTWLEGRGVDFERVAFDASRLESVVALEAFLIETRSA